MSASKRWRTGGRRARTPTETWRILRPLLPVFGITRVADLTGLDRIGIPVFTACRPNSRSLSVFQGKGLDRDAAQVSAVMEAVETWCAEQITAPLKFASIDEMMPTHDLADLARLPLMTPEGVDPAQPFLWIEADDLPTGARRWLPFELVHANYAQPEPAHSGGFLSTTNGLASGNTRDEAVLHGLMEVIERDALTLWKLGPQAWDGATALALDTVDDPACRDILDQFKSAGIDVMAWDARSDLGVPCFLALICDRESEPGVAEFGGGAHPAPEIALLRALTEAAQARLTFISGAREDIGDDAYTRAAQTDRQAQARAIIDAQAPALAFSQIKSCETETFAGDITVTLDRLAEVGITEVLTVDIGIPGLPFAVVRTVVPGLESAMEGADSPYVPGSRAAALLGEATP